MPTIYDNISKKLLAGLKDALQVSKRGDFCVGYFNLRGWRDIADEIDALPVTPGAPACRLIIGMPGNARKTVRDFYNKSELVPTNKIVAERKATHAASMARQLTYGLPTVPDEYGLRRLAQQLRSGRLRIKFFGAYPLHAKLYLVHSDEEVQPVTAFVGSSNLTISGLERQGELNIDVTDKDTATKLAEWFEERWENQWCIDISDELAEIIEHSWANGPLTPYEIYIKTAYELSKEAIAGSLEFHVPKIFQNKMLEFQKQAVLLAAERLNNSYGGVIISDVVGLGKTMVASAVAKTYQEDHGGNVLVICPPNLREMWDGYLHDYEIPGKTLSLGKVQDLPEKKRFQIVIVDESHNLRNRSSKRHGYVRDYIRENDSRVILLTATPYNKEFTDIASQLRLFIKADLDLGIRPDEKIFATGGAHNFKRNHPNTLISSLGAFEHSDKIDDWRELMRMFMVRRTRSHIQKNYAEYDEARQQQYLTFKDGQRYYFPHRVAKCAKFQMNENNMQDQYALLYSVDVVNMVENLKLPRYGLWKYLRPQYQAESPPHDTYDKEKLVIKNLSRAGERLIGFTRSQLFKRLESSGPAFILSVRRHILRNAVYLSACECGGAFPIGDVFSSVDEENLEADADDVVLNSVANDDNNVATNLTGAASIDSFLATGRRIYKTLCDTEYFKEKYQWISTRYFDASIAKLLRDDCQMLCDILDSVCEWNSASDRKLGALIKLCVEEHKDEKLLIFTQFKDTANYLYGELNNRNVESTAMVFGSMDGISGYVKRFSPVSNGENPATTEQIRILITTDTLSEGQNLQDAHIVVNFDLPWAIIRLIQRAGRVDRIGQQARQILCYCFLPEEGIEKIINLRERLADRIEQNAELIGSDERFFEGNSVNLKHVYDETISLDDQEDETDLISRAYDIWRQAIKDDDEFKQRIESLPNVVYSAKHTASESGVLAYIKTSNNQHILAQTNNQGEIVTQSQWKILDLLKCEINEPIAPVVANHHELVESAVAHIKEGYCEIGGQLGSARSIRYRVYSKLKLRLEHQEGSLFSAESLKRAIEQIYNHPLKEKSRDRLARQLHAGLSDSDLEAMVLAMWEDDELCAVRKEDESVETEIVCSMGLCK